MENNLLCNKPITFQVYLHDLEASLNNLLHKLGGGDVKSVIGKDYGVKSDNVSKILVIDVDTAQKIIDIHPKSVTTII